MTHHRALTFATLLATMVCVHVTSHADTVYKSVDNAGNVIYSDEPPEDSLLLDTMTFKQPATQEAIPNGAVPNEAISTNKAGNTNKTTSLSEQMAKTADRLKKDRMDREKAKREERQARLERARLKAASKPMVYKEEHYHNYYPSRRDYRYRPYPYWRKQQQTPLPTTTETRTRTTIRYPQFNKLPPSLFTAPPPLK